MSELPPRPWKADPNYRSWFVDAAGNELALHGYQDQLIAAVNELDRLRALESAAIAVAERYRGDVRDHVRAGAGDLSEALADLYRVVHAPIGDQS